MNHLHPLLGERPNANQIAVLSGQRSSTGRERDETNGAMEVERPRQGRAVGDAPEADRVITRAGQERPTVGAKGRTEHGVLVFEDRTDGAARGDLEESDGGGELNAEDGKIAPVGAEFGRADPRGQLG